MSGLSLASGRAAGEQQEETGQGKALQEILCTVLQQVNRATGGVLAAHLP